MAFRGSRQKLSLCAWGYTDSQQSLHKIIHTMHKTHRHKKRNKGAAMEEKKKKLWTCFHSFLLRKPMALLSRLSKEVRAGEQALLRAPWSRAVGLPGLAAVHQVCPVKADHTTNFSVSSFPDTMPCSAVARFGDVVELFPTPGLSVPFPSSRRPSCQSRAEVKGLPLTTAPGTGRCTEAKPFHAPFHVKTLFPRESQNKIAFILS